MPLLELDAVEAGYGPVKVLHGVSLTLDTGQVLGVLGANGAGKSTLMRALVGLIPLARGTVRFAGEDVSGLSAAARVHRGIGLVPEGRLLFPTLSIDDHLWLGANPARLAGAPLRERTEEILALFPILRARRGACAGVLSGGQQQMLAIGRALMSRPRLLLLDEPSMGLGPKVRREIYQVLERLLRAGDLTVVLVEQDASFALRLVGRVAVMQGGRVVREGPRDDFVLTDTLEQAYLGRVP